MKNEKKQTWRDGLLPVFTVERNNAGPGQIRRKGRIRSAIALLHFNRRTGKSLELRASESWPERCWDARASAEADAAVPRAMWIEHQGQTHQENPCVHAPRDVQRSRGKGGEGQTRVHIVSSRVMQLAGSCFSHHHNTFTVAAEHIMNQPAQECIASAS